MMTLLLTTPACVFRLAAPVFVLLMSGTAHAALTADQVWQSWKDAAGNAGMTVTAATEAKDGGTLMLNGVTIGPAGAQGLTISDMTLAEQSDGSVLITPGADIGFDYTDPANGSATLDIAHQDLTITAREEAGTLTYDYAAASLNVDFGSLYPALGTTDGAAKQAATQGKVSFEGLTGTYSDTPGANRAFGMGLNASSLAYDFTTDNPDIQMKSTSVSSTADVTLQLDMSMPQTVPLMALQSAAQFQLALQEGLSVSGRVTQGVSNGSSGQESDFMSYQMAVVAQPGESIFAFSKDGFEVDTGSSGATIDFASAMMPAPVKVTSGPLQFMVKSPVMSGDTASDYAMVVKLSQFTVNDEAWAMLDPGGVLTREPADLSIDVSGRAKIDFLAMAVAEEAGAPPPVPAPETLTINDLSAKIAGAAFAGTGAFTFDNAGGVPVPLGEANVTLTGGNALIDGLIATGLLSEEDAMGPRMMMGMFFAPGAAPDSLTSNVEARAGGEIWVNGQRIQ